MDPLVASELAKCNDGVPFRARPGHLHHTWAKTFSSLPELYLQPETLPEIEKIIRLARVCRRRLTTTGCGHSPSTLTCTSSWLLNLDRYNKIISLDAASGVVVMQSGIRLHNLCDELDGHGLAMPNLGSINVQSIAGAISTGTHGSSYHHGLMSEDIMAMRVTLADGTTRRCSAEEDPELFRASLLSLGALGIITEITFRAVPAFSLRWQQTIDADSCTLARWNVDLWTQADFVRIWWLPYTRRTIVWSADKTNEPMRAPPAQAYFDGNLGYFVYHNLLYLAQFMPRIMPWVEWLVNGLNYGFRNGSSTTAVQPSRQALLMNCLYSQYVNEWAIPLEKGPEVLSRLGSWLNRLQPGDPDYVPHNIPFSADGLYVHSPLEVRVSNTSKSNKRVAAPGHCRPYLDPTMPDGPTLYLNATLYRPYLRDPPCHARYYEAFEWLMREMGGRPHWAKNFESDATELESMYGGDLAAWRAVRDRVDPSGMFAGPWHRQHVLGGEPNTSPPVQAEKTVSESTYSYLPMEEIEIGRRRNTDIGGVLVAGSVGGSNGPAPT